MSTTVLIDGDGERRGMGWLPDHPDIRDCAADDPKIKALLAETSVPKLKPKAVPAKVDLRAWCSRDREPGLARLLHGPRRSRHASSTSSAGPTESASTHRAVSSTRRPAGSRGSLETQARSCATRWVGSACSAFRPRRTGRMTSPNSTRSRRPSATPSGRTSRRSDYYRLDPAGTDRKALLASIKARIASKLPSMFGFTVYQSIWSATGGKIPLSGGRGQSRRRSRRDGRRTRRRDLHPPLVGLEKNQRRVPGPELLGNGLGRQRLRLAALRVRPAGACSRLVGADQEGVGQHRRIRSRETERRRGPSRPAPRRRVSTSSSGGRSPRC